MITTQDIIKRNFIYKLKSSSKNNKKYIFQLKIFIDRSNNNYNLNNTNNYNLNNKNNSNIILSKENIYEFIDKIKVTNKKNNNQNKNDYLIFRINGCLTCKFFIYKYDNDYIYVKNIVELQELKKNISCNIHKSLNYKNGATILVSTFFNFIQKYFPKIKAVQLDDKAVVKNTDVSLSTYYFLKYYKPYYMEKFKFVFMDYYDNQNYIRYLHYYKKVEKLTHKRILFILRYLRNKKISSLEILKLSKKISQFQNKKLSTFLLSHTFQNKETFSTFINAVITMINPLFVNEKNIDKDTSFDEVKSFFNKMYIYYF